MQRAQFKATRDENRKTPACWRVYIPPTMSPTGKAQNVWGVTRQEAESRARERISKKQDSGFVEGLSQYELAQAIKAVELLKPTGIGLLNAVTTFLDDRNKRAVCE